MLTFVHFFDMLRGGVTRQVSQLGGLTGTFVNVNVGSIHKKI